MLFMQTVSGVDAAAVGSFTPAGVLSDPRDVLRARGCRETVGLTHVTTGAGDAFVCRSP